MAILPKIRQNIIIILCPLILSGFLLFSCAPSLKYYAKVDEYLLNQEFDSAWYLARKNTKAFDKLNAVIYYLDEGILAHYARRYSESNQSLAKAESIMDELYTKSISKHIASFIINDNTIPYRGEDFESALVNLFMAMNYVGLGSLEDALVEARKIDNKLNIFNSQYEDDKKNVYREDAFIRFLMGVLYETEGEINDAYISYWKAENIYKNDYIRNYGVSPPVFLIENLLTLSLSLDFHEEFRNIQNKYSNVLFINPIEKKSLAEIFFIHYNGFGPVKAETIFLVPMPDNHVAKIAYPEFKKRRYRISKSKIYLENLSNSCSYIFETKLMEDIASIAVMNLKNRINSIKAKAIARATAKYLAARQAYKTAKRRGGELLGLLVKSASQAASWASEQADVRHWRLLPAEIRVGRILIPPGEYKGR
ncbi:MAG: hypothetical protein HF982_02140, partial [Desulfobacteraceae bacterium]|nr:hypothetical protein [Desulfobacteraceae bacterium]MBC2718394.1 hypothetical protein [Desulfobacteraceae bacterium]